MTSSLFQAARQRWKAHCENPFLRLVRLFIARVFHGSDDSGEDEVDISMGLVLALLPLPGAFYSLFLLDKYSPLLQWFRGQHATDPLASAMPDEYLFIVLSMVVTGAVAVWRWDSIFPDRRDHANLAPLPISTSRIFLANLTTILFLAFILAVDVNAASAVLFPIAVCASMNSFSFFAHFLVVHVSVVLLSSIFTFFTIFLAIGILMVVLPYAAFRKMSLPLRAIIIAALVAMLASSFAVPSMLAVLPLTGVRFLPPVWFLGLCQWLRHRGHASLDALGRDSLMITVAVIVLALIIYAVSYRRWFLRIPEVADVSSTGSKAGGAWFFSLVDHTMLRSTFQRSAYRFVLRTLARSERHSLAVGAFLALGVVIASQFLYASFSGKRIAAGTIPSPQLLAIPLIVSYCTILGIRFAFEIPAEIRANWVFRLYVDKSRHECVALARKIMLSFVLPWVFAVVLPIYTYVWNWRVGGLLTTVVAAWSFFLAEILLFKFRKVPCTCSYPAFRDAALLLAFLYVLGFFAFAVATSKLIHWALIKPAVLALFVAIPAGVWFVLSRLHEEIPEIDKELIFEENAPAAFELLDLRRGS